MIIFKKKIPNENIMFVFVALIALSCLIWVTGIKHRNKYGVKCSDGGNIYTWTESFQGTTIQTIPGKHEYFVRKIDSTMNLHMLLNLDSCGAEVEPMIMIFRNIADSSVSGGIYEKIQQSGRSQIVTYEPIMKK